MPEIRGATELQAFRAKWTGKAMLDLIHANGGRVCVGWPIGVGKSFNIDLVIEEAIRSGRHDLVVALFPTRQVINERPWIKNPPGDVSVINLRPRPQNRCGPGLNDLWQVYEQRSLGLLGRVELCAQCPRHAGCFWPSQYGKGLDDGRVIVGTQAHLESSPSFITQLISRTRSNRPLVLLDEVNFAMTSLQRCIRRKHLARFVEVLKAVPRWQSSQDHQEWVYLTDLLLLASSEDLRVDEWEMPEYHSGWALHLQRQGWQVHGEEFRFLVYDLIQFGRSPLESREKNSQGDICFAAPPWLGTNFVIYSGTASPVLLQHRLGKSVASPFTDYRFRHPDTRWFNIASRLGTASYFPRNSPQIFDFFAGLISTRLQRGHHILLVARKQFMSKCKTGMEMRLHSLGHPDVRVILGIEDGTDLFDSSIIPLINFGCVGTNLYQDFNAVYCLTGYYARLSVINSAVQDLFSTDRQIPIRITTGGRPRRRTAGVLRPQDRVYDVDRLAQLALQQQETDVVLQAVGRVRPYTQPREVITFQCADHPWLAYTQEFMNIEQARKYFEIPSRRQLQATRIRSLVQLARAEGLTQAQTAAEINVSLSTVKRNWNLTMVS